jgi:ATP-binding cassette subfamily E protein 1
MLIISFGVCTMPYGTREGINIFLDGYIPTENLRFRDESLTFKISENADDSVVQRTKTFQYPTMTKTLGNFKLNVEAGSFSDSEIIVLLGENGMGKTTLVQMLAGKLEPDNTKDTLQLKVSMKPQLSKSSFSVTGFH